MKEFFDSELFNDIKNFFKDAAERIGNISEPGKPFILKSFIAIIALLTTLSIGMMVIDSFEEKTEVTTTLPEYEAETTTETTTEYIAVKDLQTNILFCLDDENNNIHLLFLADVDSTTQKLKVFFIDPASVCKAKEIEGNMNYHLKLGGITQLVAAVGVYTGVEVDKYLMGDEKALVSLLKYMGDLEIQVDKNISYSHAGLNYIIDKGRQVMTPDVLLKYFLYLSTNTVENSEKLKEICSLFASTLFDCASSQEAQDNFGSVIGFFETNISAMDFSENKGAVMKLSHELMLNFEAYNTLVEFKGLAEEE